jgi:hypothetical protein
MGTYLTSSCASRRCWGLSNLVSTCARPDKPLFLPHRHLLLRTSHRVKPYLVHMFSYPQHVYHVSTSGMNQNFGLVCRLTSIAEHIDPQDDLQTAYEHIIQLSLAMVRVNGAHTMATAAVRRFGKRLTGGRSYSINRCRHLPM